MSEIITSLRNDHRNIAKLLILLSEQTSRLARGEFTDYQILADIMQYFINYPDIYHHPHEEQIFEILKIREKATTELIRRVSSEHQQIANNGTAILYEIKQIQGSAIFSREKLVGQLDNYISSYEAHMDIEESYLFQVAEKLLRPEDWQHIDTAMKTVNDPIFGKILDQEYQSLFKAILAETVPEQTDH